MHNVSGHLGTTIVPGAGHWVQQEAPEAVNRVLIDFLERVRR
ncbi:alpha/beta fold hydrolase [Massilia suwonensis]|uniref:Alpha/beta fold hydrolase n=1 Tax=Massilia suwonensis TaxID=648895 RepID=A0ABW0ML14_9BURK